MSKTKKKTFNYIDLFAGAGGLSEGFLREGFKSIAHVEMNKEACDTLRTRVACHYLSKKNKLDVYYSYLKGEISREQLWSLIPQKIMESVIHSEISDNTRNSIFNKIRENLQKDEEVDIIIGGPPCQAYSLLGRYQNNIEKDPRNKLYIQYGKFLEEFNPKGFVFENVPGLLSSKDDHFKNLRIYFEKKGYEV